MSLSGVKEVISELIQAYSKKLKVTKLHEALAEKYKLDSTQISRYEELFGNIDEVKAILETSEDEILKTIRVNTLRISRRRLIEILKTKGLEIKEYKPVNYGIIIESSPLPLGALHEYLYGYFTIQGPASMLAVPFLSAEKGSRVLDCCAGAGIKTTQLAQHTNQPIIAVDRSKRKLAALKNNLSRLGVYNVIALADDSRNIKYLGMIFDRILVDAPCSGEGLWVFRKLRRARSIADILSRVKLQYELLDAMVRVLSIHGTLIYATCSMSVEENEFVVSKILEKYEYLDIEPINRIAGMGSQGVIEYMGLSLDSRVSGCIRFYPHKDSTEGFTICRLIKRG